MDFPPHPLSARRPRAASLSPGAVSATAPDPQCDWIYGDYLMKNDQVSLVIAAPLETRHANMTIRHIGGSILDLSLNHPSNDQLSAYIPTGGRYLFEVDPKG